MKEGGERREGEGGRVKEGGERREGKAATRRTIQ